jgi:hypothetical protein
VDYIVIDEGDQLTAIPANEEIFGKVVALIKVRKDLDVMLITSDYDNAKYRDYLHKIFKKLKKRG